MVNKGVEALIAIIGGNFEWRRNGRASNAVGRVGTKVTTMLFRFSFSDRVAITFSFLVCGDSRISFRTTSSAYGSKATLERLVCRFKSGYFGRPGRKENATVSMKVSFRADTS